MTNQRRHYFECHITFVDPLANGNVIRRPITKGWKFSRIDGDPTLGDGTKSYLTKHFNIKTHIRSMYTEMRKGADELNAHGFRVLRIKVEHVIHDEVFA